MKFAITATDRYLGVFEAFVEAGWTPLKLFTEQAKNVLSSQSAVISFAEQNNAAVQISKMTVLDLTELHRLGCEVLVVASYPHKIHDWRPFLKYAVNFHPSPLPVGRGPYPIVRAILENRDIWAVTCHRLTSELDKGDILASKEFSLQPDECHESIDLKTQIAAKRLATEIADQFIPLWEQAIPQEAGEYWNRPTIEERVLNFQMPVEQIMRQIRAYGANGTFALINNSWLDVKRAIGWTEQHHDVPSLVVHCFDKSIVIAALDGYIGLLDYAPVAETNRMSIGFQRTG